MSALEVRGPALTLRYPAEADAERLFELARDPEVTRFFSWRLDRAEQSREWIAARPAAREAGEALELAIVHRDEGVIGITSLLEPSRRDRRATLGTWLGRPYWGSGANAESKALICALAFRRLGLERLTATASVGNVRSQAALDRLGFTREGVLAAWNRHGDEVHDVVIFRLLRGEWERSALAAVEVEVGGEPPDAWAMG